MVSKSTHERIIDGQSALPTVPEMIKFPINMKKVFDLFKKKKKPELPEYKYFCSMKPCGYISENIKPCDCRTETDKQLCCGSCDRSPWIKTK